VIWETLRAVFDSTGFRGLLGEVSKGYNQVKPQLQLTDSQDREDHYR
jgi:hypothetical protein